jgi:16S rRNA (adenine1518-N6/adenine1519-N6)-dimethyltransferase
MHIKPKKSLGQNFLIDQNIQRKIITACNFRPTDIVLEIGAGRGELTRLIAKQVNYIYAVEIDPYLFNILKSKFKDYPNVKIIKRDILKLDLEGFLKDSRSKDKIKVVGNIPYYITTPIIEHLLKNSNKIDTIFITVQKEFAKRITSGPGSKDYGALSCFVQYYTAPKILFTIRKTSFLPHPKVDSCFLRIQIHKDSFIKAENERRFFRITRSAFNQRRKTLRNSLRDIVSPQKLELFFKNFGIDPNIRPENLSLQDFINLSEI